MRPQRYYALDGLRGIAAAAVLFFHAPLMLGVQLAPGGYLAVDIFFQLSGYVLAHAYGARITSGLDPWALLRTRVARFYPLHVLGTLLGLLLFFGYLFTGSEQARPAGELALLFTAALLFIPWEWFPLNVPAWSLFFELITNCIYGLMGRNAANARLLWAIVLVAFITLAVFKIVGENPDSVVLNIVYQSSRAVFSFFTGVLLYQTKPLPIRFPAPAVMAIVLCLLVIPIAEPQRPIFDLVCIAALFPVAISLLSQDQSKTLAGTYIVLGKGSFPLYAVHYPMLHLANGLANFLNINATVTAWITIVLLLLLSPVLGGVIDNHHSSTRRVRQAQR